MAKKTAKTAKKSKSKKASITPDEAIERLSLRHIRLISSNSQLNIADSEIPSDGQVTFKTFVAPTKDMKGLHVNVEVDMHASSDPGNEAVSFVRMQMTYQTVYAMDPPLTVDEIEKTGEALGAIGALVAWPHIREFVQSLSFRMGIPGFLLPLYTVGPGFQKRLGGVASSTKLIESK